MGTRTGPGQEKPPTALTGPFQGNAGGHGAGSTTGVGADIPPDTAVSATADLGATAASPDGDEANDDPRVVAISLALQESADLWVKVVKGEVQLDTEVAAIIAIATLGDGYCSERCHVEELDAVMAAIRDQPAAATRDEIIDQLLTDQDDR